MGGGGLDKVCMTRLNRRGENKTLVTSTQGLGEDGGEDLDPELEALPMPNFLELAFYMHQASTGFSTDELLRIGLSVKKLIATEPLQKVRLWGKILGSDKNYIVIEGDWQEGEGSSALCSILVDVCQICA